MESLSRGRDIITKMSNNYRILQYYDYAYESIQVLRSLCRDTRNLWLNEPDATARFLEKQIIDFKSHPIDENTIKLLKRGNRYKLFKIVISLNTKKKDRLKIIYQILEAMPKIEIYKIIAYDINNGIINALLQMPAF